MGAGAWLMQSRGALGQPLRLAARPEPLGAVAAQQRGVGEHAGLDAGVCPAGT